MRICFPMMDTDLLGKNLKEYKAVAEKALRNLPAEVNAKPHREEGWKFSMQVFYGEDPTNFYVTSKSEIVYFEKECDLLQRVTSAAVTGMRESEVLGIRRETLNEKFIDCDKQFLRGKLSPLKTKDARKIPICKELYDLLDKHTGKHKYTFDRGDGIPLGVNAIVEKFDKVVRAHFPSERDEKGLVFHSLRHFYNTYLQAENVPVNKVDAIIGHSSGKGSMTANYTHWSPEMFPEVYLAHEKLVKLLVV